jgi:hypothetical protein
LWLLVSPWLDPNVPVLTQAVAATAKVNLAMPVKFFNLKGSLSAFGELTLKGCLAVSGTYLVSV